MRDPDASERWHAAPCVAEMHAKRVLVMYDRRLLCKLC